ncbi:hypothetical protein ABKV19_004375 [Rosa sericea]
MILHATHNVLKLSIPYRHILFPVELIQSQQLIGDNPSPMKLLPLTPSSIGLPSTSILLLKPLGSFHGLL